MRRKEKKNKRKDNEDQWKRRQSCLFGLGFLSVNCSAHVGPVETLSVSVFSNPVTLSRACDLNTGQSKGLKEPQANASGFPAPSYKGKFSCKEK